MTYALSPLLFIIIMDVLAEKARTKPPWAMLFADDLVLVSETVEELEEELERWRAVIEDKGFSTQFQQRIYYRFIQTVPASDVQTR